MRSVLIVDDDPFIRKLVSTTLEDVAGFELHQAEDGQQALTVAAEVEPAIVFLDIAMPAADPPKTGFEQRGGASWTTHEEELAFLGAVQAASPRVAVTEIGRTKQ